jgi:5'-deoxynucleotidase YfbR-like HD superfamily hydrolase
MSLHTQILAARESAQVERCHTLPHIGSYTVGQHCYGALALLLLLHEAPSLNLIKAVAFHDLPERWLGDIPSPGKLGSLAKSFEEVEAEIFEKLGFKFDLADDDKYWLKLVDALDLWCWAKEQQMLGNHAADEIAGRLGGWLQHSPLPDGVREFIWFRTQRPARLSSRFSEVPL